MINEGLTIALDELVDHFHAEIRIDEELEEALHLLGVQTLLSSITDGSSDNAYWRKKRNLRWYSL